MRSEVALVCIPVCPAPAPSLIVRSLTAELASATLSVSDDAAPLSRNVLPRPEPTTSTALPNTTLAFVVMAPGPISTRSRPPFTFAASSAACSEP